MSYARISSRRIAGGIVVAVALFAVGAAVVSSHSVPRPAGRSSSGRALTQVSGVARQSIVRAYAKLPLVFVPNAGQASKSIRYYAQGPNFSFYFARSKAVLVLAKGDRRQVLDLRFLAALGPFAGPCSAPPRCWTRALRCRARPPCDRERTRRVDRGVRSRGASKW